MHLYSCAVNASIIFFTGAMMIDHLSLESHGTNELKIF